jgi:hypothetical protein
MDRFILHPVVGIGAVVLFVGHLGMYVLPSTLAGLPTPILLIGGMAAAISAAVRWL